MKFREIAGTMAAAAKKKKPAGRKAKKAKGAAKSTKAKKSPTGQKGPGRPVTKGSRGALMKRYGTVSKVTGKKKWRKGLAEGVMVNGKFHRNKLAKNGGKKVLYNTVTKKVVGSWSAQPYKGAKGGRHRFVNAKERVTTSNEKRAKAMKGGTGVKGAISSKMAAPRPSKGRKRAKLA